MTFVAAAIGGAAVLGGALLSSNASKSAANTQAQAARDANQTSLDIFNQQTALQEPWRQSGQAALGRLNTLLGLGSPPPNSGLGFTPTRTAGPQIVPGSGLGGAVAPLLTQGADGVFSPDNFNEQAYLAANSDVAKYIQQHPGTTALQHYQTFGKNEGRLLAPAAPGTVESDTDIWRRLAGQFTDANGNVNSDALNPAVWAEAARQKQAAAAAAQPQAPAVDASGQPLPPPPPPPNDLSSFGALNQPFSASDFAADAAPKADPFVNPYAIPTFDPKTALQEDPGYQFRASEQEKALQRAAAAQGRFGSGSYLKDAMARAGDLASQEYGNVFNRYQVNRTNAVNDNKDALGVYSLNRANSLQDFQGAFDRFQTDRLNVLNPLFSVAGLGQQATNQTSAAAGNYGAQAAAAITGAGNARAAGQVGSANAINGAIGQGISMYQQNQLLSRFPVGNTSLYTGGGVTPPNPYYGAGYTAGFDPSLGSAYSGF